MTYVDNKTASVVIVYESVTSTERVQLLLSSSLGRNVCAKRTFFLTTELVN